MPGAVMRFIFAAELGVKRSSSSSLPKAPMLWLVRLSILTLVLTSSSLPPASLCQVDPGPVGTLLVLQGELQLY
eukprot:13449447-Heterocapsa_arctica.AAC.1